MTPPPITREARDCCTKAVSPDGWHWRLCGKPAKWSVRGKPLCGIHARKFPEKQPITAKDKP